MTPEEKHAIAAMMQRLAAVIADRRALITILKQSVNDREVPQDWEQRLEELRSTPEYQAILNQYAQIIRKFEEDAQIEALLPLIEQMSKGKPPN